MLLKVFVFFVFVMVIGFFFQVYVVDIIKVGIMYLFFGMMVIFEMLLKDVVLMVIDDINVKGGVLGKKLELVVVDLVFNWLLFVEKVCQLLVQDKVVVVFGCWMLVLCKLVLLVFEELNGLLFYLVQYEGEEMFFNVFYIGVVFNQQVILVVEYLLSEDGGGVKCFFLLGMDYVYLCIINKIFCVFLYVKGIQDKDIEEVYILFGYSDYQIIVVNIKKFVVGGKMVVVFIINGDFNVLFYKELVNQGLKVIDVLVVVFLVGEEELCGIDIKLLVGNFVVWNYFEFVDNLINKVFVVDYCVYVKVYKLLNVDMVVINDLMEVIWVGLYMWVQVVIKVGIIDVDKVCEVMVGQIFNVLFGFILIMDVINYYLYKLVMIGEIEGNGQFNVVWQIDKFVCVQLWSLWIFGNDKKFDYLVKIVSQ